MHEHHSEPKNKIVRFNIVNKENHCDPCRKEASLLSCFGEKKFSLSKKWFLVVRTYFIVTYMRVHCSLPACTICINKRWWWWWCMVTYFVMTARPNGDNWLSPWENAADHWSSTMSALSSWHWCWWWWWWECATQTDRQANEMISNFIMSLDQAFDRTLHSITNKFIVCHALADGLEYDYTSEYRVYCPSLHSLDHFRGGLDSQLLSGTEYRQNAVQEKLKTQVNIPKQISRPISIECYSGFVASYGTLHARNVVDLLYSSRTRMERHFLEQPGWILGLGLLVEQSDGGKMSAASSGCQSKRTGYRVAQKRKSLSRIFIQSY